MDEKKLRILVVDDERSSIDELAYILKPKYSMLVAKDGPTAVELSQEHKPDLILLDVVMPGMSGFEVIGDLKGNDLTRRIPVIFITGRDNAEDEEAGLSLGAVDYITKPFHNSIVKARVNTHIQMVEYMRTIERVSLTDALTNIPNRRSFDNRIKGEWSRALREGGSLSLLMIDIDDFKNYNDLCGHMRGDEALKIMAAIFERAVRRPFDFVARWGGEEFAVLLPGTNLCGGVDTAERIRESVEKAAFPGSGDSEARMTVSIGVNAAVPSRDSSMEDFIAGADKGLYLAKASGKNAVRTVEKVPEH